MTNYVYFLKYIYIYLFLLIIYIFMIKIVFNLNVFICMHVLHAIFFNNLTNHLYFYNKNCV